ncbi:type IV secretion system protein VirB10 [Bartonella sp. B35(2025)]
MFDNKKGDEIDTGVKLDYAEKQYIDGDCAEEQHIENAYGISELGSERRQTIPGARALLIVGLVAIVAIPVALSWKALKMRNTVDVNEEKPQQIVQQVIPSYTPKIYEEPKVLEEVKQPPQAEEQIQDTPPSWTELLQTTIPSHLVKDSEELARKRMLNSGFNHSGSSESSENYPRNDVSSDDTNSGILFNKLQPVRLGQSYATQLRNRDLLITQGTQIDCTLETKIITTQPGMTTCHLTRDVYSTSGRVVLLDRGSKVVGFYQSGLQQGQARVFVQWSRVETPSGVIINLDSPSTGSLGEAGIGGWVDRHFWERFSGAIMISIVSDFGEWLKSKMINTAKDSPQPSNAQNAESIVMETLQNSINIVPTLYKNQGERVNIFVARDLDFSNVYSLVAR